MGADKAFLEFDGETFLERAVKTLAEICDVKIVLNQSQTHFIEKLPAGTKYIFDVFENRGAPGGIHTALQNCAGEFAVILAVDLPFVTTEAIENLANFALASNKYIATVPRQTDGRPQPLCAIYRAKYCLPTLEKLLNENDSASVRDFLDLIFPKYVEAKRLDANDNLLFNVNFPSDFEQMC